MAQMGTQERRDAMANALRARGYTAAAEACQNDPTWETWYADLLGSMYDALTAREQRDIFPWNFETAARNPHPPVAGDETLDCAGCGQPVSVNDDLMADGSRVSHVNCETDPERQRFLRAMGV